MSESREPESVWSPVPAGKPAADPPAWTPFTEPPAPVSGPRGGAGIERADGSPGWPVWYGLAAMFVSLFIFLFLLGPAVLALRALTGLEPDASPSLAIGLTLVSDFVLVGVALVIASFTAPPRPRHFGLRPTALWPAVGFCALGVAAYFVFGAIFEAIYPQEVRQSTLETLGAGRSTFALVAVGVLVVVLAPLVEELFFRGFLYRSLRTRLSIPAAALLAGTLFGLMHVSTGAAASLPLALLGVVFCLIVERTGSLYPTIALHAVVNAVAYSVAADAPAGSVAVAMPLLAAMLAACLLLPRLGRAAPAGVGPAPVTS